ncbi:MAG: DUF1836 domain-containing protein [Ruminococcaceae bacterium]|nr:DUF1836 domain-containing protein [Oscillospiraceae bacterium]
MTEQELREIVALAVGDVDLKEEEIPAIDLYLDQILSLIAEKNATSTPCYQSRSLTKTMINNYSKDGLISPITGKKYSRSHIVEMLLVYSMKNTLSIDEIKRTLTGVREECGFSGADMINAYRRYLELKACNRERAGQTVEDMLKEGGLDVRNDYDYFLAILNVLSLSSYLKEIGREMLTARYADLATVELNHLEEADAEKRERKEGKVAAKRERKEEKVAVKQVKVAVKQKKKEQKVQAKQERKTLPTDPENQ